eukprot:977383-Pelagomonas_calceolata.AAC.1
MARLVELGARSRICTSCWARTLATRGNSKRATYVVTARDRALDEENRVLRAETPRNPFTKRERERGRERERERERGRGKERKMSMGNRSVSSNSICLVMERKEKKNYVGRGKKGKRNGRPTPAKRPRALRKGPLIKNLTRASPKGLQT